MASMPNLQKPPKWITEGDTYTVRSLAFGEFTARCVQAHVAWAVIELLDLSPQLAEAGYKLGGYLEVSRELTSIGLLV